jgi:hypothetical protein
MWEKTTKVLMRDGKIGWLVRESEYDDETRYRIFINRAEERYRIPKGKQRPFDIIEIDEA